MSNYHKPVIITNWLKRSMVKLGYDKRQIFKAAQLDKTQKYSTLKVMPHTNLLMALEWVASDQNNPDLGFDLCLDSEPGDFGPVTLMAYQCPTLRDFIETMIKYQSLISSGINMEMNVGSSETEFTYNLIVPNRPGSRIDIDYTLKLFTDMIRDNDEWRPIRTELTYSEPEDSTRLRKEFGKKILFDQPNNRVYFESYLLEKQINDTDPQLLELLKNEILTMLEGFNEKSNLLQRVRACIASSLSSGNCNSENIAKQLNISQRSMVRHLSALDTSLREIKSAIIEELAKTALSKTQSSVYEIALQMGFSETSAFDRMFKKKTGYTPIQYREKYLHAKNKSHLF